MMNCLQYQMFLDFTLGVRNMPGAAAGGTWQDLRV